MRKTIILILLSVRNELSNVDNTFSGVVCFLLLFVNVFSNTVEILTSANFDEKVLQSSSGKWFVKFYAPWCPHCMELSPVWNQLAEIVPDSIHIAEIDGSQNQDVFSRYNLHSIPTLLLFINVYFFLLI
ncbi:uncharacterized protein [Blastocystis hominis]|uniref:Thioredoxin domain-containing protein n=1 Tax=Blastocystis hominis TaxID=12968 RepID=D8LZU0_BLAHO|nr:uncharacterized protein [Blastocystis hominis]CBK21329.2 unnamed protein product [Blastocystis hominis]|eukprot:XP_012895377.1 uncharacterized protein [Blastocystis hominis]